MAFKIDAKIGADGTEFISEIEKVRKKTEDVGKSGEAAGKKVGKGIDKGTNKAEKSVNELRKEANDEFQRVARSSAKAGKSIGKEFKKGANKAKAEAKGIRGAVGKAFSGVGGQIAGALAVGAMVGKAKEAADWAANIRDVSSQFGLSTEEVQKFEYAATQSGVELGTVMDAMKDLGKNTSEALEFGSANKIWAFKQFGLTIDEIKGKNVGDIFKMISREVENFGTLTADQTKAFEELMGGSGFQSIHMMRSGLEDMMSTADDLGLVVENSVVMELGRAADKFKEMKSRSMPILASMAIGFSRIGIAASDAMTTAMSSFEGMATKFMLWKNNLEGQDEQEAGEKQQAEIDKGKKDEDKKKFQERFLTGDAADSLKGKSGKELTEHEEKMKALADKRRAAAAKLAELQEAEKKRAFDKLPPAQKALELERQIAEEKRKQLELAKQLQKTQGADKARAALDKAKQERTKAKGEHGNVDEVLEEAGKLNELKGRQQRLEATGQRVSGDEKFGIKDAEAEVRGAKQLMSNFVIANPRVDFVQLDEDMQRLDELKARRDKYAAEGDLEGVKAEEAAIKGQRTGMEERSGLNADQQREFVRIRTQVVDAENQYELEVQAGTGGQQGWNEAQAQAAKAQADNMKEIEATQARINALREQYGDDAVDAAMAAQSAVSEAELNLEAQSQALRAQFAQAKTDLAAIQTGDAGAFGVTTNKASADKGEARLAVQQLQSATTAQKGGKGITEEDGRFGFMDAEGQFQYLSESAEAAQQFWAALPSQMAAAQAELAAKTEAHNAALIKQEEESAKKRAQVTQLGNQLAIQEGGGQQTEVAQLQSKAKEEQLKAEQEQLKATAEKEAQMKQGPMAGDNKFSQLARIGGQLGGRNPVLDMAQKQFKATESVASNTKETMKAVKTLAGV